ncbi:MAG: oligosaccharide flippase family protein [Planctomycetaceae bacterium]|nr:oligosaccharide flippase family protein [Planctomycetaceae bacterium]
MGFVKKATLLGVSEFFLACGGILSTVIYSRYLGPERVGQLAVFMSTLTIVVPLVSLGIGRANIYFLNTGRFDRNQVINSSLAVGLLIALGLTGAMTGFFYSRAAFYGTFSLTVLFIFSFGMSCSVMISLLRSVLLAELASRRIMLVDVIQRIVMIVAAFVLAIMGVLSVGWAMCINTLAGLAGVFLLLFFLRNDLKFSLRFERDWFVETASYGIKVAATGILYAMTASLTVLILRQRLSDDFAAVGFYTRAVAISGFAVLIPRALSPLFYAKWADATNTDKTVQIERAARFNVCYGTLAALGLVFFGKLIVWVLYGNEFLPAYRVLYVFAPAMVLMCLFSIFNSVLTSDGRASTTAWTLLISLLVVAAMTYFLVPVYGMFGAALAVLCGNLLSTVILAVTCRSRYGLKLMRMLVITRADIDYFVKALAR